MSGWRLQEYLCPRHGRFESLEHAPPPSESACPRCAKAAPSVISATHYKTCWASAGTQGKPEPPPAPTATNTEKLGEGMKYQDWRAERKAMWREHDRKRRRSKGLPL